MKHNNVILLKIIFLQMIKFLRIYDSTDQISLIHMKILASEISTSFLEAIKKSRISIIVQGQF